LKVRPPFYRPQAIKTLGHVLEKGNGSPSMYVLKVLISLTSFYLHDLSGVEEWDPWKVVYSIWTNAGTVVVLLLTAQQ